MPGADPEGGKGRAAIVVLGHGSRAPEAAGLLEWVAATLGRRTGCTALAASLQFNRPSLADCCRKLAAAGSRRILIAPYFLYEGNHMQRDIPAELASLREEFPETGFVLAAPLGADERLVEVMETRLLDVGHQALEKAKTETSYTDGGWRIADERESPLPDGESRNSNEAGNREPETGDGKPAPGIEKQSFDIIDGLLGIDDDGDPEYQVVRRVIHASGDPSLAGALAFSPGAAAAAAEALANGAHIFCDVNMAAAGIAPAAGRAGLSVACAVAEPEAASLATWEGISRSAAGLRLLARRFGLGGSVVAVGNAPTALFEALRLIRREGDRPALVVGVPVGFVGAAESKQALIESGMPYVALPGNRGGSGIAAAIVNALLGLSQRI